MHILQSYSHAMRVRDKYVHVLKSYSHAMRVRLRLGRGISTYMYFKNVLKVGFIDPVKK